MQENLTTTPAWIKPNIFVDIRDRSNQWRVCLILNITKTHIRVRYDGQPPKYDQNIHISSVNIKPFRSITRGCTTQTENQTCIRQQYTFTQSIQKQKQKQLDEFMTTFQNKSEYEITQYLRGEHYVWLDFLLTVTYKTNNQINIVYEYFFKQFQLLKIYLEEMLKTASFDQWFNGQNLNGEYSESMKAFAQSCYQIADSVYSLTLEGHQRLRAFNKTNQALISQFVGQNSTHTEIVYTYLEQIGIHQLLQETLDKISKDNKSTIKLYFITSIGRLFCGIERSIKQKEKKKQLTLKLCEIMLRQCGKMHEIATKEQEIQIDKMYSMAKSLLQKYNCKGEYLRRFQVINMELWKAMIMTEKLQRKIKGLHKLKTYYGLVISPSKQIFMIYNNKESVNAQLKKLQIFRSIFYENQHHEIIKKGCELANYIYKQNGISGIQLQVIWKSCRNRLEAVRKVIYSFFQSICKQLKIEDLILVTKLVINEPFAEQMDKNFFYTLFANIVDSAKQQKIQILKVLFDFGYRRILELPQQTKQFAEILVMTKAQRLHFTQKYMIKFIKQVSLQKSHEQTMFFIKLLNLMYSMAKTSGFDLQTSCFGQVFQTLKSVLTVKIKDQHPITEDQKRQKVAGLLRLFQNICSQFQLQGSQFTQIWDIFQESYNHLLKQQQFLPWIIRISYKGILKIQVVQLNSCFHNIKLKKQIFNTIFKKSSNHIDFINLSEMQFKIYKKFQLQVNKQQKNIQERQFGNTGIHYFRVSQKAQTIIGLRQLFDIMMNCRNTNVVKKSVQLIKQFHLNYRFDVDSGLRVKKIEELMSKIYKYVGQGLKKSNIRLIKNMLSLLFEVVISVKQIFKLPSTYPYHSYYKGGKKIIKVVKDDLQPKDFQVSYIQPLKNLKNLICKTYSVALYNLKMFKMTFQSKKVDDNDDLFSQEGSAAASAGSSQSPSYTKNSPKFSIVKTPVCEQIPNQILIAPVYTLTLSDPQSKIQVIQKPNVIYQSISQFICQKMSDYLLKILGDSQMYTKQSSQLAYHILIQIPTSMQSLQILNNLINQLKSKSHKSPNIENTNNSQLNLSSQSINFRMYFCKNINRLKDDQFIQFLSAENVKNYQGIFKEISKRIVESQQIQLILQVINLAKKGINKMLIPQHILNTHDILLCMINLMQFIIGPESTEQFKKSQKFDQFQSERKVFYECLNVIEFMHIKCRARIINSLVQSEYFEKLLVYLFITLHKTQFAEIFATKLQKFFKIVLKQKGMLQDKTQIKLCYVIFDVLYYNVIKNKTRRNTPFFKIIRDLISISNIQTVQRLFKKDPNAQFPSFWENCLNIIYTESDFHNQQQKQNTFLNGHLYILESIIRKNPKIVDLDLCKMIFYNCLCYQENQSISEQVKCVSKPSVNAALTALYAICCQNQKYIKFIVTELRRYQQTQYWRTNQFWTINIELQTKSQCGFVGLYNPGCICYLNSFTQTLFMNQQFRNKVINYQPVNKAKDYTLLSQMRKLFLNLQYSNQKYLNPVPFSQSIRTDQGKTMIKIYEQMDIQEYSSILFDKIQRILPKDQDFVKEIFGGTYSNDIISQECKHSSQRQENFLSMQVDVKPTLQQSLKTLVKGEILQGQNAYFCQKCNKKVRAIKRMSIKKLPNYLIICLKRFQYNFEVDAKIKVNSYCQFSKQISLQPFSQQFLNQQQDFQTQSQTRPHEYFNYKLKGVIIHTGTSQSGHYYTLIQTSPETWLQFNDSSVTQFDIQKLSQQAFGSDDSLNPKAARNAYMLIYQRKNKIYPQNKDKMQNESQSKQILTEQAQKIHTEIQQKNKQIQTFHLMLGPQYFNFVKQLIALAKKQNFVLKQLHKQNHIDKNISNLNLGQKQKQINKDKDSLPIINNNKYSNETIIEILKFYFEYCVFVRARDANLTAFLDCLQDLETMLSFEFCIPVLDYIMHQLSQKHVIQELLVQVSIKQKVIVLSHFFLNIIKLRIKQWKKNYSKQVQINIMRLIQSMMEVVIENSNCLNQILFIIRSMIEEDRRILGYCQKINVFGYVFEVLIGMNQSEENKKDKLQLLRKQAMFHIKDLQSPQVIVQEMKQNQMEQQIADFFYMETYQIRAVKKSGKCVLKQQSPQQAWTYIYKIIKIQDQIQRNIELQLQKQPQGQKSPLITILACRRHFHQVEFLKLKDTRITHFITESQGAKSASAMGLFLCQFMHDNKKITEKIMGVIKDALKKLEVVKFRYFLVVLFYIVMHQDRITQFRNNNALKILTNSLTQNAKYFSQIDILHQWIMKMTLLSKVFFEQVTRTQQGGQLLNQIVQRLDILKKPTTEMMKKQKNPNYDRLNYMIHGLMVSADYEDYEKLYDTKKQFFENLFHQKPLPAQVSNPYKLFLYRQPGYDQLTHRIKAGNIFMYLFGKKWTHIFVKNYRYGILKVHKIIKDTQRGKNLMNQQNRKKQVQPKTGNYVSINNQIIDIGLNNRLSEQQSIIYENDQRLKLFCYPLNPQPVQKQPHHSSKPIPDSLRMQNEQQSDISYQSDMMSYNMEHLN